MHDLVQAFRCETFDIGDNVITYGEKGDCFYVILKGVVSIHIPNPKIKNWRSTR